MPESGEISKFASNWAAKDDNDGAVGRSVNTSKRIHIWSPTDPTRRFRLAAAAAETYVLAKKLLAVR